MNRLVVKRVAGCHRGAGFIADVGGFVSGEDHRLGVFDSACSDEIAVVVQRDVAALGEPATVVGEFHPDLVATGGDRHVGDRGELLDAEGVVHELRLAVLCVDGPSAESAALGDDDAVGASTNDPNASFVTEIGSMANGATLTSCTVPRRHPDMPSWIHLPSESAHRSARCGESGGDHDPTAPQCPSHPIGRDLVYSTPSLMPPADASHTDRESHAKHEHCLALSGRTGIRFVCATLRAGRTRLRVGTVSVTTLVVLAE